MAETYQLEEFAKKLCTPPLVVAGLSYGEAYARGFELALKHKTAERLWALAIAIPCCRCSLPMDQVTVTRDAGRALGIGCLSLGCSRHVTRP